MTELFLFCDMLLKKIRIITIDHKDAIFHIDSDMCIILRQLLLWQPVARLHL